MLVTEHFVKEQLENRWRYICSTLTRIGLTGGELQLEFTGKYLQRAAGQTKEANPKKVAPDAYSFHPGPICGRLHKKARM